MTTGPYALYRPIAQAIAIAIIIGVAGLSAMRCSLLSEAVDEFGPAGYVAGNFAIHYYPALRIYSAQSKKCNKAPSPNQAASAFAIFLAFLAYNNAAKVYGCDVAENVIVVAAAGGIIIAFAAEEHANDYYNAALKALRQQNLPGAQPSHRQTHHKPASAPQE